jgi:hypothetical protein
MGSAWLGSRHCHSDRVTHPHRAGGGVMEPMIVPNRELVSWVSSLPRTWTDPAERLVLTYLALDAYEGREWVRPGASALAQWTGMHRSSVWEVLGRLRQDVPDRRPALIVQKAGAKGLRTAFRIRTEVHSIPSGHTGQTRPATPDAPPHRTGPVTHPSATRPVTQDAPISPSPKSSSEDAMTDEELNELTAIGLAAGRRWSEREIEGAYIAVRLRAPALNASDLVAYGAINATSNLGGYVARIPDADLQRSADAGSTTRARYQRGEPPVRDAAGLTKPRRDPSRPCKHGISGGDTFAAGDEFAPFYSVAGCHACEADRHQMAVSA